MLEDLTPLLKLWTFRLLNQPREWRQFVKSDKFADDDVAEWLGFDSTTGKLRPGNIPPKVTQLTKSRARKAEASERPDFRKQVSKVWKRLRQHSENQSLTVSDFPELAHRLKILGKAYGLNSVEQKIWLVSFFRDNYDTFRDALYLMANASRRQYLINLSKMFRVPAPRVLSAIHPQSPLFRLNLLCWSSDRKGGAFLDCQVGTLREAFLEPAFSAEKLLQQIVNPVPASPLRFTDFPMLKEELDIIIPYLKASVHSKKQGVNLLFHGEPGTGKTQMSRMLGEVVKRSVYEVSYAEEKRGSSPEGRMESLTRALTLMRNRNALLVFDEAEDLFRGSIFERSFAQKRKGHFNQLLETNPIPVIWISNSIHSMDPAFLRRFDFVLEFTPPSPKQRKKIFSKVSNHLLNESFLEQLAKHEDLTPAVVERACQVAAALPTSGNKNSPERQKAVRMLLRNTLKAQGSPTWKKISKPPRQEPTTYRTQYLNTDVQLNDLAESLAKRPEARMCLYGPPGTGKTSFGHFLSRTLELPLLIKRASDLISPFIGETERKMARAFEEATRDDAILLIDEVDSFLRDRRGAVRSWEVTEVNEFLTQMEAFEGIFIASTNLVDNLDPAAARRFDFKVHFDYLRPDQAEALFREQITHLKLPPIENTLIEEITTMTTLTPGDFANLARQHRLRPFPSPQAYLKALQSEIDHKSENRKLIGFTRK